MATVTVKSLEGLQHLADNANADIAPYPPVNWP